MAAPISLNLGVPMFIDPHIHTNASPCGKASLKEVVRQSVYLGLEAIVITDHDTLTRVPRHPQIHIFTGEEISSYGGHILAYGIQEAIPYGLPDEETIDRIHDQGGIAVAAHPFRRLIGRPHVHRREPPPWSLGEKILGLPLDGIETLNGANHHHENVHAHKTAKLLRLPGIGGSDAHRLQNIGSALTFCSSSIESIDDFIKAVLH
ncbi:MAG: PHP-associated domain-containing protein, partial [Candidatus Ranarchaeia archaeon]